MSAPRLLTLAEIAAWDLMMRRAIPKEALGTFESIVATLRNGAADRRVQDAEAVEHESRSIAKFLLDQARRT